MAMQLHFGKNAEQVVEELRVDRKTIMTLVTHHNPHHDELVAFVIFIEYCAKKFPGILHICFDFCRNGQQYRGKDFYENLKDNYFCIGIGGGPCDEHASKGEPSKKDKCAAILVAEYLRVRWLPELSLMLKWTCIMDTTKNNDPSAPSNKVKKMYRRGATFSQAFEFVQKEVGEIISEQKDQIRDSRAEFRTKAIIDKYEIDGKRFPVVTIESDDVNVAPFSRSRHGVYAAIVTQKSSKGLVQISGNDHLNYEALPFVNIVAVVRVTEAELTGTTHQLNWTELVTEGRLSCAENWFYHVEMGSLMNGSESHPDEIPTKIPLELLRALVKIALTPELFEKFLQSKGITRS